MRRLALALDLTQALVWVSVQALVPVRVLVQESAPVLALERALVLVPAQGQVLVSASDEQRYGSRRVSALRRCGRSHTLVDKENQHSHT